MHCTICAAVADRACTRCGYFFCREHGGMRRGWGAAGKRALCDRCTPNQRLSAIWPLLGLAIAAGVALAVYFAVVRPALEEQEQVLRDFQKRQRDQQEFRRP